MSKASCVAIDTNVLVRVIAGDDAIQSALAEAFIENIESLRGTIFLPTTVIIETTWVLERLYDATKAELLELLDRLLSSPTYTFEKREIIQQAVVIYRQGSLGYADAVILATCQYESVSVYTFDKKASKSGMTMLNSPPFL